MSTKYAIVALLERAANPNLRDKDGWTALMMAVCYGHTDAVAALLDKGADPNVQDKDGWKALMWAAWHGYPEAVRALLAVGAWPFSEGTPGGEPHAEG